MRHWMADMAQVMMIVKFLLFHMQEPLDHSVALLITSKVSQIALNDNLNQVISPDEAS